MVRSGAIFGVALAINDAGVIVGLAATADNKQNFQFHAALWTDGKITDLKALDPDHCSLASSVNSQGQIVGLSGDCSLDDPTLRAVISENGGPVVDLNSLISPDSGVQLRNATFINDRGEIAAVGSYPDGTHGPVLLIPCEKGQDCQNVGQHSHPNSHQSEIRGTAARDSLLNRSGAPWMRGLHGTQLLNRPFDFRKQSPKH